MTKRIFRAMVAVALLILVAGFTLSTGFLHHYYNNQRVRQLKAELQFITGIINDMGTGYFKHLDLSTSRYTIVDEDGTVIYDTEADMAALENHGDREEIREAFETGYGSSARQSSTLMKETFYEAVLLENGDVLRVSVSQLTIAALVMDMTPAIILIMVVAVVGSFVLSRRMARKITEPLNQLNLENPKENNTYEELSPMLTKIHKQHKQIKEQMEILHKKTDEFNQIMSSMNEGLVLLDEHGIILSMNNAAKELFAVKEDVIGQDFLTVDRTPEMSRAIEKAFRDKRTEIRLFKNGAENQFNISRIDSGGKALGTVILAFDITDKAFAERNRQEFTANVTHELKTPLQSIIGSAELLENGLVKPEDMSKFVGNIRKEAARLVTLINDIIRLSQLDENINPAMEVVNMMSVAQEVVEVLTVAASKKQVTLQIDGEACAVNGIRRYIYEIIYNLVDNAIRYNVEGGTVTITLRNEGNNVSVIVSDTGIGIPMEHQARIFERFYRVDKSHSKETGGTGLGLSIVKHAVACHGGRIHLESEPGKGTSIQVTI